MRGCHTRTFTVQKSNARSRMVVTYITVTFMPNKEPKKYRANAEHLNSKWNIKAMG